MNAYQFGTVMRRSILKGVRQERNFFLRKVYDAVVVSRRVPIAILIFYATTQSVAVMRKAGVNGVGVEQIVDRDEAR